MKASLALSAVLAAIPLGLPAQPSAPPTAPSAEAAATDAKPARTGLRFNFRGAPLDTVLTYLSEAAGFVIVLETPVRGTVDMWSAQPVSRDEAVQLLNLAINKNGLTATLRGRSLVVSSKEEAKKRNIPIRTGNDPREIPDNAEMVMQIIPLRHIDSQQAARDLATLLPGSATITANQDSNSLVVTDTQSNVRHIVELVAALDGSTDTVSTMRVFKLKNADPTEMASLLTNLFQGPSSGSNRGGTQGVMPGFPGGFPFGGRMFGGQGGSGGSQGGNSRRGGSGGNQTAARGTPVVAVADPRTYSVIVTADKDAMPDIAAMVSQLDASAARKQKVFVYTLENADVRQVETVLKNLFQSSNARSTTSTTPDPLATRASSNAQATSTNITLGTNRRN